MLIKIQFHRFNVVSPTVSMVSNTILGVVYEGVWRISRFLIYIKYVSHIARVRDMRIA